MSALGAAIAAIMAIFSPCVYRAPVAVTAAPVVVTAAPVVQDECCYGDTFHVGGDRSVSLYWAEVTTTRADGAVLGQRRYVAIHGGAGYDVTCDDANAYGINKTLALAFLNSPTDGTCEITGVHGRP